MRSLVRILCVSLVVAGCGDEEEPPPAPRRSDRATAGGPAGRAAAGARPGERMQVLQRIEDRAADEKERRTLRHRFRDTDFAFDPTGTMNRDPFRSYVVAQPGVSTTEQGGGGLVAEPTEQCPSKKQIATSANARELKLIGIVSRGTRRWALLEEAGQKGHIVHLGDCVGKEKARVTKIGATFLEAEIAADPSAVNQPVRPAEKIAYQLHPKQLPVLEDLEEREAEARPERGTVTPGVRPPPPGQL